MFRSSKDVVCRTPAEVPREVREEQELYGCDYCSDGGWASETEVEIHNTNIHYNKIKRSLTQGWQYCGTCFKEFDNEENLLKHIKSQHLLSNEDSYRVEREIFICHMCHQLFFNKLHLIIHITRHYGSVKRQYQVTCPCCHKNKNYYRIYSHCYLLQSTVTCRICFFKCKNRKNLQNHVKKHPFHLKCEMCHFRTNDSGIFNKHIKNNHKVDNTDSDTEDIDVKKYFVPKYGNLMGKGDILFATRGFSLPNNVKICVFCREICSGVDDMKNHILREHNTIASEEEEEEKEEEKVEMKFEYYCLCGKVFNNKVLLKHHVFKLKGDHKIVEDLNKSNIGLFC